MRLSKLLTSFGIIAAFLGHDNGFAVLLILGMGLVAYLIEHILN